MIALDHQFYLVDKAEQRALGRKPRVGYERLVEFNGRYYWYTWTYHQGVRVPALMNAGGWRLVNGHAVLAAD